MGATNCPETPRQRMIAMMYLVLTALLALNVSKEVIQAFVLVEQGLDKTIENVNEKNLGVYDTFLQRELNEEAKVRPWREKADAVKLMSEDLRIYIDTLKRHIIYAADGKDAPAIGTKGEIYTDSIQKADNLEAGGIVMIGSSYNGEAYELHKKLDTFRDILLNDMVDPSASALIGSIKATLNTDDPVKNVKEGGEKKTWEIARFDQLPMIACITLLTKIQTDVSNAESDVINYLLAQVDAKEIKVNKIDAVVKAKRSAVFKGDKYEADIFLAAFDTTQQPNVYIGRYDSTVLANGDVDYQMRGSDYQTLEVQNGKAIYTVTAGSVNPAVNWGGLIEIQTPGGIKKRYPFEAEYTVSEAALVISPIKMNVFYLGVENPVDISVPGLTKDKLTVTMDNGKIRSNADGTWTVEPTEIDMMGNKTKINVTAEIDGVKKSMGSVKFRVKRVPDPVAKVFNMKGGEIQKNVLVAQGGVFCEIEDFDFDMKFIVTSFQVSAKPGGSEYWVKDDSKNNQFTNNQKEIMKRLRRGDKLIIDDIKAKGPSDKTPRTLSPIIFKIL